MSISKTAKDLKLSFDFEITNYENRVLSVILNGYVFDTKYEKNFFEWFMEDLISFVESNNFKKRWDFQLIHITNAKSLNLTDEEFNEFHSLFKTVTSWDMKVEK